MANIKKKNRVVELDRKIENIDKKIKRLERQQKVKEQKLNKLFEDNPELAVGRIEKDKTQKKLSRYEIMILDE